jgi:LPXTG-motif cell wall-anchored protein
MYALSLARVSDWPIRLGLALMIIASLIVWGPGARLAAAQADQNIVQTAQAAGQFNTLVAAVQAAGLVDTLSGPGPFTVFAPTDEAFAKLPAGTVDNLLKNPEQLRKVLTYHVVAGSVPASQVVGLTSATTVQGENVAIRVQGGNVMVNNANVVATDVMASNGIIHVIDAVILPPSMTAPTQLPRTGDATTPIVPLVSLAALMVVGGLAIRQRALGASRS